MSAWDNAEIVAELRQLWAENKTSCTDIASYLTKKYGVPISRNAVIGKVQRLGLECHKQAGTERSKATREAKRNPPPLRIPEEMIKPVVPSEQPKKERVPQYGDYTILDLKERSCRWPMSDNSADMRYCGIRQVDGSSYCERHRNIAWSRPRVIR